MLMAGTFAILPVGIASGNAIMDKSKLRAIGKAAYEQFIQDGGKVTYTRKDNLEKKRKRVHLRLRKKK